ncbi:pancreatic secretory granule membrane major glycoprotein GP2-like [Hypanus sabinus]|uniref:pancreatic secretory granule membrane major glycoprotein GP2-like n=1 Tax=Hypanus sabinus TaxID=79690 RepID=UPI0028C4A153|nr:pancreatic secretory granule membrane major glycoprotein GP2-like [Hypanus sabinus]
MHGFSPGSPVSSQCPKTYRVLWDWVHFTLFINLIPGLHPNVGEGEVTKTVCFTVGENACFGSRDIRVKNCSGYFVYRLKPTPRSNAVYCTVTDSALGDPCVTHTVLDQPWRSTNCSNTECTGGQWMDDGNLAVGWYRFNSSGGWKIPETVVPQDHCSGQIPGWLNGRVRISNSGALLFMGRSN